MDRICQNTRNSYSWLDGGAGTGSEGGGGGEMVNITCIIDTEDCFDRSKMGLIIRVNGVEKFTVPQQDLEESARFQVLTYNFQAQIYDTDDIEVEIKGQTPLNTDNNIIVNTNGRGFEYTIDGTYSINGVGYTFGIPWLEKGGWAGKTSWSDVLDRYYTGGTATLNIKINNINVLTMAPEYNEATQIFNLADKATVSPLPLPAAPITGKDMAGFVDTDAGNNSKFIFENCFTNAYFTISSTDTFTNNMIFEKSVTMKKHFKRPSTNVTQTTILSLKDNYDTKFNNYSAYNKKMTNRHNYMKNKPKKIKYQIKILYKIIIQIIIIQIKIT